MCRSRSVAQFIDARRLALMKPSAYLINTARGPIVNEAALVEALEKRRIAGAGLDVFEEEPLPSGSSAHEARQRRAHAALGWTTDHGYRAIRGDGRDALLAYLDGREFPIFKPH